MPQDLNVYVTTASNAQESSFGTYCPGMEPSPPPEYITCLGDLYSVAWMEDRYAAFHFQCQKAGGEFWNVVTNLRAHCNCNTSYVMGMIKEGAQ